MNRQPQDPRKALGGRRTCTHEDPLFLAALGLATLGFVPAAAAHQDGCLVAQHVGTVQFHQLCFTEPHTCFSNVKADGIQVSVQCGDPANHPCLLRVWGQLQGEAEFCGP